MSEITKALLVLSLATAASAQTLSKGDPLPQIEGETMSGTRLTLPAAGLGKVNLVIMTFSKGAGGHAREWLRAFLKDYQDPEAVTSHQLMMLEGVPGVFRGLVKRGIRSGVPKDLHGRFLFVFTDEARWKEHVQFSKDDFPYLLLLDVKGRLAWSHNGKYDAGAYGQLRQQITELLKKN